MDPCDAGRFRALRRTCAAALLATLGVTCLLFGATVVRGASMYPTLVPGDIAIYRRSPAAPRVGDIVLYRKAGWPGGILHRVIERHSGGEVRTRGDANTVADREPVGPRQVRGIVVAVVPIGHACAHAAAAVH